MSPALMIEPSSVPSAALPAGVTEIVINGEVTLPVISTLEEFVEWRMSDECPERGRFAYLDGTVWVDLMSEQLYTHNRVKMAFTMVLGQLEIELGTGTYFTDGADLVNDSVSLATTPDGMYVADATFDSGRVVEQPNRHQVGFVRLQGTPDMVLEILSDSSEEKDHITLPTRYHAAGIPEFWRVDARGALRFEILRRDPSGYQPTQQPDGWWRSEVLGRDFLLTAGVNSRGQPRFTLQHRP